jgi:hypothetical protein
MFGQALVLRMKIVEVQFPPDSFDGTIESGEQSSPDPEVTS